MNLKARFIMHQKNIIPLCSCVKLTFFNELECNLALASTTKAIQNKDMTLPQIFGKICTHLRENVMPSSEN
jgi:hypothetical protein